MDAPASNHGVDVAVPMPPPDFGPLAKKLRGLTRKQRLLVNLLYFPGWVSRLLRRLPIISLGKYALVTRYDDVIEVLGRAEDFPAPFEANFKSLDRTDESFILAMPLDAKYRAIHAEAMKIFRLSDLPRIAAFSAERAEQLVAAGNGAIDCMGDLQTRVTLDIVEDYFGIPTAGAEFPLYLFAMSGASFLDPPGSNPDLWRAGHEASRCVGGLVDEAIRQAHAGHPDLSRIVGRFVAAQRNGAEVLSDDVIRATIVGFILGFVPTNNLAAGRIMQWLLQNPDTLAQARDAACSGDDDLLGRVLFEALRFNPIPTPGRFRVCAADTSIAAGTPREKRIKAGTWVFASTLAASFDPTRVAHPNRFDPYRGSADTMRFGWGQHWCVGFGIAIAQITQTLKPLLKRADLRAAVGRSGEPDWFAMVFYEHLNVTYRT